MQLTQIINGQILLPDRILHQGSVLIEGNRILEVSETVNLVQGAHVLDAGGLYVSPGFIDIHVHGGGGADFMDATPEAFLTIAETHLRFGTTSMVPTTLTGTTTEGILRTLEVYEAASTFNDKGSQFLGLHLEGPYFAMSQRGAQDPRYIRYPDKAEYTRILSSSSSIRRWSAAPELPGALEFADFLVSQKVLPAIAHTDAVYEDVLQAVEHGYSLVTHLYSGMSGVMRRNAFRYAGVIESALLLDQLDVEIIADGAHLPKALLQLIVKVKGPDRIALITDAMRAAGTSDSQGVLGSLTEGIPVLIEDEVAKLPDRSAFAGSIATCDRLVRTMVQLAEVPLVDAVTMMTATPARIMNVQDSKGRIAPAMVADIILFDEEINIRMVMIGGKLMIPPF